MTSENIGSARYRIDLDKGTFTTGVRSAEQDLNKLKAAGDRVTSGNGGISKSLGGVGRTAVAVALGMGGLNIAVTGLSTALKGTVAAAAADAASQARLQAAVRATGAAYKDYAAQLDAVIKKGQQRGFSDDQTRSALAILIAQTNSVSEATKRYAIAQDLARGANIDVVAASRLLGKVTADNVTALQRYGISVKSGATETEALAEIQAKFAGQAEAYANSTAGQFDRTTDSIAEAGEAIGRILLPGVAALSEQVAASAVHVESLATKLSGLGEVGAAAFPSVIQGAVGLGAALVALRAIETGGQFLKGIGSQIAQIRQVNAENAALGGAAGGGVDLSTSSTTIGAIGQKLASPQAAAVGLTVAFVALDAAVRHFTGGGLIDYLTGATAAHNRAAAAAKLQGDTEENLSRLAKLGVSDTNARLLQIAAISGAVVAAQARLDKVSASQRDVKQGGFDIFAPGQAASVNIGGSSANQNFNAELDKAAQNVRDLQLPYVQLAEFAKNNPILGDRLKGDLEAARTLLVQVRGEIGATADVIRNARSEFDKGLSLAVGELGAANPVAEQLKVTVLQLEDMKRHLQDIGDDDGVAKIDAQIASLNNRIAETEAPAAIAQQALRAWGAAALAAAGDNEAAISRVTSQVTKLGDTLTHLPPELKIKLALLDPEHIRDLIAAMAAGLSFEVAVNLVSGTPAQQANNLASTWAGSTPGSPQSNAVQNIVTNQATDAFNKWVSAAEDQRRAADNSAGAFEKQSGAAAQATKDTQIWSDGIIDLGEAMAEGLSAAQVAVLENEHDAEVAAFGLADALFRQQVETERAAMSGDSLQIALVQIATELIKSKRTVEEWNLDEVIKPKLDAVNSMIDSIFSKPTKEGLELELKKAQLERRKLLLEQGGADASNVGKKGTKKDPAPAASQADRNLKSVNDQLTSLQREIDLRNKDFEIAKLQTDLKDQTLQTDADLLNANQFLGTALESLTGTADKLDDALGIRVFDSALAAASALQAVGAAGGTGFTAAEKHWINGVAIANGEPPPFPGFKAGLDFVPRDNMPALLHYGERVLTRDEATSYRAGDNHFSFAMPSGLDEAGIERLMVRKFREWMRSAQGAGASSGPTAYAPGRR